VALSRRAGAPRLIDWTGERCVPWAPDIAVVYEHFHRYLWAARLVAGRRVLDLGSGEGFGAAILADAAVEVVGIDIDAITVDHSNLNYAGPNLSFHAGSAADLSAFADASFDAVVAFEVIEHLVEQERLLSEVARVLTPDGLLVISTPDRRAYSDATGQENPFHLRELTQAEFTALLRTEFPHVACAGQRTMTGSRLDRLGAGDPTAADFFIERLGEEWRQAGGLSPLYVVALASRAPLPEVPGSSTLADFDLTLMRQQERRAVLAGADVDHLRRELDDTRAALRREQARLEAEVRAEAAAAAEVGRKARSDHDELTAAVRSQLEQRDAELAAAHREAADLAARLGAEQEELRSLRRRARRVEESVTWTAFQLARRRLYAALGGEGSAPARALSWSLRRAGRLARPSRPAAPAVVASTAPDPGPWIRFPAYAEPKVSLLVAIHARADLTKACLRSILTHTIGVAYEVILLDDAADPETKRLLAGVAGARTLVNASNLGFLRTVNRGAESARGSWLVVMNNDTEVTYGWLEAMLDCAESADDVGVVTPKYVYPDGRLQEAGALIWRDATGVNVGRGEDPAHCLYDYRRQTDYGSGAALMVRTSFWREVGGFDERFAPMYYEDADLCLQAAEHGLRVLYEPRAVVIHFEGATAGTDANPRQKRHQELNRPKFESKWRHRLEREHLRSAATNTRLAIDRHPGPHVLIVDHRVVTWDRDAGSQRMLGIIRGFLAEGCHVTFLPHNLVPIAPYTQELQRLGVAVLYGHVDLRAELATIGPRLKLIVLSRPQTASAWVDSFRELAPSARLAYDTVDLHWLREARRAGIADGSLGPLPPRARALRELELAMMRATDETWVVTREEAAQVRADVPDAKVRIVPIFHELEPHVPPAESRSGVLFVGGFEHTPNVAAALELVRRVMPAVWAEIGDVRVTIVGPNPPPEVSLLASPLVDVTGWVDDLEPLLRSSRLLVAPISYGAGLKGKVTQALAAGLPVVTTPLGVEGLAPVEGEQVLVGRDTAELVRHVVRACTDDRLWERLSAGGQELIARYCSAEVIADQLRAALHDARAGLGWAPAPSARG
jgi:GT2 family glycosyltransferase/SAM-dependent methyltransferase/glycosyltransferase involved in cell wall biosynthesis